MPGHAERALAALKDSLREMGPLAVAFSGGVDSSLVACVAGMVSPEAVLLYFADSQLQPRRERRLAASVAAGLGLPLRIVGFDVLAREEIASNPLDRCYFCKRAVMGRFLELARGDGAAVLVDGTNADDDLDDRPGARACRELGVRSPLREAGIGKENIRRLARELGLPNWNKPSASCLATRIPAGTPLSPERLALVEHGEEILATLGYRGTRLRIDASGERALVELAAGDWDRASRPAARHAILHRLRRVGFRKVFLDLSEREGILSSPNKA